jgi:hypothetical protein
MGLFAYFLMDRKIPLGDTYHFSGRIPFLVSQREITTTP